MKPLLAMVVFLTWGCSRTSALSSPSPPSPAAPATSAAPVVPLATASPPTAPFPCVLAAGYRGTVAGQPVFARLGSGGKGVHGRYFYERVGTDIALDGTLSRAGVLELTEVSAGKTTGAFSGTCDGRADTLSGTWTAGAKSAPFELKAIPPGDAPVVAVKRLSFSKPAPHDGTLPIKACSYKEERIELFGLRNPAVETTLNHQALEPLVRPVLDPDDAREASKCDDVGIEIEMSQHLVGAFRELATLQTGGWLQAASAAHGINDLGFRLETFDLRSGRAVTPHDVFARNPMALVKACIEKTWTNKDLGPDAVEGNFDLKSFDLTSQGIHFFGQDFPHAIAVFTGEGPTIGYDVLLRDGYLKSDSPVSRAWEGVTPADKKVVACPKGSVAWGGQ